MSSPAKNKISVSVSSSSPSMPSRPNTKPRNSETGDLMRRSFRGNPFSTDPSRRNSLGKESSNLVEFVDKENDKDLISSNVVVNKGLKVSKHFMSPTISAVSKINPSPRKRILSDKNEMSRSFDKAHHQVKSSSSSVSFSDVISIIGDEIRIDEKEESYDDITVTDLDENLENKCDDGSSFKISPLPPPCVPYTFPVFESYDVDPMVVAPYDPKKNYLSPRPQFLHYKPNPRIENRFDECKQLEELFSSSSETDLSAEEEVDSQEVAVEEETEEILDVDDGEERLEAAESDKEVVVEEEVVCESVEEETHQVSKQTRFKMSKLLGWVMVLGVAYVLVVSSVAFTQPSIIEGSPFYQFHIPPEIVMSARERFEQLGAKLRMSAESSLVYIDKLISSLREEEGHGGPFQFHNLTNLLEDKSLSDSVFQTTGGEISVDGFLVDSQDWSLEMDIEEENVLSHQEPEEEQENSGEISLEAVYEEDGNEVEQESEVNSEMDTEFDEQAEIKIATGIEVNGCEIYSEPLSEEGNGEQETEVVEGKRDYEENDQKNIEEGHESETGIAQNDEKNMEESESNGHHQFDDVESATISGHQQKETEVGNAETVSEEGSVGEIVGNSFGVSEEATDVEHDGNEVEVESGFGEAVNDAGSEGIVLSKQKKVVVVISTVMVLLAAAVAAGFLLAKKKTKPVKMQQREDCEPTTVSATEVKHVPVENLIKERLSSLNLKEEEEEVGDDREREVSSVPSEMSFSFSKNKSLHSCSNNRDDLKENQSGGGGGKKSNDSGESMASSASEYSIGTVSYGSFTTYEKIQKRSGHKEKEMITPVRRSSRIRNHQHSGQ